MLNTWVVVEEGGEAAAEEDERTGVEFPKSFAYRNLLMALTVVEKEKENGECCFCDGVYWVVGAEQEGEEAARNSPRKPAAPR